MARFIVLVVAAVLVFTTALSVLRKFSPYTSSLNEQTVIAVAITAVIMWLIAKNR
jgi:hypothetical protein